MRPYPRAVRVVSRTLAAFAAMVCAALIATLPARAESDGGETLPSEGLLGARSFTLENGLEGIVIPNHRAPVVLHMVLYRVGGVDETPGKTGLAHFFEHMMFKGTKRHPQGELDALIARNGGQHNAFTTNDYTGYYQNIAADRLDLVMGLEADRMTGLVFNDTDFATEMKVVLEERFMRIENSPGALLNERLDTALFTPHPYGQPLIGWERDLRGLTAADAHAFYDRWYAPENALLIVVGDVTFEDVRKLAEKNYGSIPRKNLAARNINHNLRPTGDVRVTLHHERVTDPDITRIYVAPSLSLSDPATVYATQLVETIVGGGAASRLNTSLVLDQKLAAHASAYYRDTAASVGQFYLSATPAPGIDPADVEAALDAEIARLLEGGITEQEVADAKARFAASLAYARDSLFTGARIVGAMRIAGLTLDQIEHWPDAVQDITVDQVNTAARDLFGSAPHATGILLPEKAGDKTASGYTHPSPIFSEHAP